MLEPPDEYLDKHLVLTQPDSADWKAATEWLRTEGNQYTLFLMESIPRNQLTEKQTQWLLDLDARLRTNHKAVSLDPLEVQFLLERAAYADLICHRLEYSLRNWTLHYIRKFREMPEIHTELARIRDHYVSHIATNTLYDDDDFPASEDSNVH